MNSDFKLLIINWFLKIRAREYKKSRVVNFVELLGVEWYSILTFVGFGLIFTSIKVNMEAIKLSSLPVHKNQVLVELPAGFEAKSVDIVLWPSQAEGNSTYDPEVLRSLSGLIRSKQTEQEIEGQLIKLRKEWSRNI